MVQPTSTSTSSSPFTSSLLSISPEVQAAVAYLSFHLGSTSPSFSNALASLLSIRYAAHWHPDDPERGSAYRALTQCGPFIDVLLQRAISDAALLITVPEAADALAKSMQSDRWTLWVDPGCVSVRLHEGAQITSDATIGSKNSGTGGIKEIWGKLPASYTTSPRDERDRDAALMLTRHKTPFAGDPNATAMSEFAELVNTALSPTKRSKAIAIVRPGSVSADKAELMQLKRASTPPPPLPPLAFTLEESTSPYVPSFINLTTTTISQSHSNCTTPTPLASSPLATGGSTDSNCADPFARPSSRSSTTSVGSNTSGSIFSHSSCESYSSSVASCTTMASSAASLASATPFIPKATPHEMDQAALFSFPGGLGSLAVQSISSAPSSPSKHRRAPRHHGHGHTLSTSSAVSTSSFTSGQGATHTRGRSSQFNIRVNPASGQVQDYSNGKVGVLGGGVLLGLAGSSNSKSNNTGDKPKRPQHRPTSSSSSSSNSLNGGSGEIPLARSRSKSRAPSTGAAAAAATYPTWYAHHQYHPVPPMASQWMQGQA
ncbi:MAG: BTG, member 2 [Cyphobasidiales sp. Tagirdzhanova-0007]|nr:MAG: BTG, member 2 [Cyphobasidiales sp. Tagirdzhanova-0007]